MSLHTALTERLAIDHPILLAPMAGVSGGRLAAAVSAAGGLGIIGGGYGNRDWLATELAAAGNAAIGVGFITWSLAKEPALLDLALERAPKAIMLSFGDVGPFASKVKAAGIPLICQIQNLAQAHEVIAEGADVVIAQGTEAGGHGARRATLPLVPAVVDIAGGVPVVAAGGIADGRGLAAALMLGAAGVLCGTAFYVSNESLVHANLKRAAVAGHGDETLRSSVIDVARDITWPEPFNIRTLRNDFIDEWAANLPGLRAGRAREQARYVKARDAGDTSVSAVIVGEGIDLIHAEAAAGDIVRAMVAGAEARLRAAEGYLG
jgi:nitronate monooxygenase